ncbi:hypothetical protein Tco_0845434 [Tanacetum coccineum]
MLWLLMVDDTSAPFLILLLDRQHVQVILRELQHVQVIPPGSSRSLQIWERQSASNCKSWLKDKDTRGKDKRY